MLPAKLIPTLNRCIPQYGDAGHTLPDSSKAPLSKANSPEAGLTLIECLVAIIMVGIIAALISPVLVISVATRVNSQRTEQAMALAQAEIDGVRAVMERGRLTADSVDTLLPPAIQFTGDAVEQKTAGGQTYTLEYPQAIDGPDASQPLLGLDATFEDLGVFNARQVDATGDGNANFAIQVYRSQGQVDSNDIPVAFSMGVRVYDIRAFENTTSGSLATELARAGVISTEGERGSLPLAVLYTTIAKADIANSYCDYIEFLGGTPSSTYDCN